MNTPLPNNEETIRKAKALMDNLEANAPSDPPSRRSGVKRAPGGPNLVIILSPLWAWVLVMLYLKPTGAAAFFTHLLLGGAFVVLTMWSWKGSLGGLNSFLGGSENKNNNSSPEELHEEVRRAKERRNRYESMRVRQEKMSKRRKSE